MKPLYLTISGGPGNPASLTLTEALEALNSLRFGYLGNADREKLAKDLHSLARSIVMAAMSYRDEHPEMQISFENIDALLKVERS